MSKKTTSQVRYTEAEKKKFASFIAKNNIAAAKREFGVSAHTLRIIRDAAGIKPAKSTAKPSKGKAKKVVAKSDADLL